MRGEHIGSAHHLQGFLKSVSRTDQFSRTLQDQESRVPFVHVPNAGVITQHSQGAQTSHAKQNFLRNAHFRVAAVQAGRQGAIAGRIFRHIGIQQVNRHPTHPNFPHPGNHFAAGKLDREGYWLIVRVQDRLDGQLLQRVRSVGGLLPAILGDPLGEVSLGIEQAYRHKGQT